MANLNSKPYTAWQLIHSYWQSEHKLFAYFMLIVVVVFSVMIVGMEVVFNYWYNDFYDALQDYDVRSAYQLIVIFCFLATVIIVISVYRYYVQNYLALCWRRWLTNQFLHQWLGHKSYYYLENFEDKTDNPDQRIQEDINALVTSSLDLSVGIIAAITTFVAFIYILWTLSGHITLHFGSAIFVIPGYLVWVSIIYAIVGTFLAFKIGYPLVPLNFEQQKREADFRFALVDLRSHAEPVALYRGEPHERSVLGKLFERALTNWYAIILRQKLLLWFTAGYNQISVLLPLVVVLPNYFSKVFKLGGLIQALRAFTQIQDSLSFLVNSYSQIAVWRAVVRRLLTFINHIHAVEADAVKRNKFSFTDKSKDVIAVRDMSISTPRGELLLKNINEEFVHGKNYLIKSPSGYGKSTFVRTIARIWPYGVGEIDLPKDKTIMYLPQNTYMPIGTLKEALIFPEKHSHHSDAELAEILRECDLAHLIERLHDMPDDSKTFQLKRWSEQLSPGELQRIAFARVLIQKPHWVFMDEATSSLDLPHEAQLFKLIQKHLPHCSMISIGHQPSVEKYHDVQIDFTKYHVERGSPA